MKKITQAVIGRAMAAFEAGINEWHIAHRREAHRRFPDVYAVTHVPPYALTETPGDAGRATLEIFEGEHAETAARLFQRNKVITMMLAAVFALENDSVDQRFAQAHKHMRALCKGSNIDIMISIETVTDSVIVKGYHGSAWTDHRFVTWGDIETAAVNPLILAIDAVHAKLKEGPPKDEMDDEASPLKEE
jgi:hypothetical protein